MNLRPVNKPQDENGKEKYSENEPKRTRTVSTEVLDTFWNLTEVVDETRIESAVTLLDLLKKDWEGNDEELKYCVKRLITGLSSARQAAPNGYATALCEMLKVFRDKMNLSQLLNIIDQQLMHTKHDNKHHQTHASLGKLLAFTCLIRSGMINQDTERSELKTVIDSIAKIRKRQASLAAVTSETLAQLCSQVKSADLTAVITESLQEELTAGWEKCSADSLQLLIVATQSGIIDSQFLAEHWESDQLTSVRNFPHLSRIMQQSIAYHPIIHPVNNCLVNLVASTGPKHLDKFWSSVVVNEVFRVDKQSRCFLVYHMIPEMLMRVESAKSVSNVLSPDILGPSIKHLVHRKSDLHKSAVKLMARIAEVVKCRSEPDFQMSVLRCLLTEPGSFMFDSVTSTKSVSAIVYNMSMDASMELAHHLMAVITDQQPLFGNTGEGMIAWCSLTLTNMLTALSLTSNADFVWQLSILKFLTLHSCFRVVKAQPNLDHCSKSVTLTTADRLAVRDALINSLSSLSTFQPASKSNTDQAFDYTSLLWELMDYVKTLVSSGPHIMSIQDLSDEVMAVWSETVDACVKLKAKLASISNDSQLRALYEAFQMMLQLFGIHLFLVDSSDTGEVVDTIKEVLACYKKASSKGKLKKDEPEWCDVITEVLISLMSKSSHLFRSISTNFFTKLLPFTTVSSIQRIVDVFESTGDDFDDDQDVEMEEDHMEPVNGGSEVDMEDGDELPDSDESEEEEESDEESDEEDGEVNEELRATIQAALGPAALASQSDEDEDLSDSEMFKRDELVAAAFRSMRKENKNSPQQIEKRKEIKHFKLRCLDLIDVAVKHSTKGELLLELMQPLIVLIDIGYKETEMKEIGKKAQNIYHHLISLKKIPRLTVTDRELITEKVKDILTLSTNPYARLIMKEITSALSFMMKLLGNADEPTKPKAKGKKAPVESAPLVSLVVEPVKEALNDFLTKRESRYSNILFHGIFERQPVLFWSCALELARAAGDPDVRIFCRTQASVLCVLLLPKNIVCQLSTGEWDKFQQAVKEAISGVADFSSTNYKSGFLLEFFNLLHRCKTVHKQWEMDLSGFTPIRPKFGKDLMKSFRRLSPSTPSKTVKSPTVNKALTKRSENATNGGSSEQPVKKKRRKTAVGVKANTP